MPSIHIISASTSGHTEYVTDVLSGYLRERAPHIEVTQQRAESAMPDDLLRGDLLILASGTWNYGGAEGQLNTHMRSLLFERADGLDLSGKNIAFISLGDDRYYFTTRCTERFMHFQKNACAKMALIPLIIVNEPYGQEERIHKWSDKLITLLAPAPSASPAASASVPGDNAASPAASPSVPRDDGERIAQ